MYDWLLYGGIFALGYLVKCVVNFIDDWIEEHNIRKAIEWYGLNPEAQRNTSEAVPTPDPQPLELVRTERCPEGWSAKQVLGYGGGMWGPYVAPTYPGEIKAWDRRNDGAVA